MNEETGVSHWKRKYTIRVTITDMTHIYHSAGINNVELCHVAGCFVVKLPVSPPYRKRKALSVYKLNLIHSKVEE